MIRLYIVKIVGNGDKKEAVKMRCKINLLKAFDGGDIDLIRTLFAIQIVR